VTSESKVPLTELDEKNETIEFENDHVRVLRVKTGPGEKRRHRKRLDRVLVWLSDAHEKRTASDGTTREVKHRAGDVAFREASEHALENLKDVPVHLLVIELKHKQS